MNRPDRLRAHCPAWLTAAALAVLAAAALTGRAQEAPAPAQHDEAVDQAIERGLAYLAKAQEADGCFPSNWGKNTGVTSLCVMAFLAKGHTPGPGPYEAVVNRGLDFVLASRRQDGLLVGNDQSHGPMYAHTISTLLLSEVSGMVDADRQAKIDTLLPEALGIILSAQRVDKLDPFKGGWRYQQDSNDSDISTTGWPLMALRSARNTGADVPKEAIEYALEFIMRCRTPDGGFAYQPGQEPGPARTGVALLCLELCGRHRCEAALGAGDWLLKHPPQNANEAWYHYAIYYCAQGMYQLGDDYWQPFAARMYEYLLKSQQQDGSWPVGSAGREGPCYATAMSILAMSVPYCQLPIYQR